MSYANTEFSVKSKPSWLVALISLCVLMLLNTGASAAEADGKIFGKGRAFTLEELPASTLKNQLLALPPAERGAAMKWLHSFTFAANDVAHLRTDKNGGIYYACPPGDHHHHDHAHHAHDHDAHDHDVHDHDVHDHDVGGAPAKSSESNVTTAEAVVTDVTKGSEPVVAKAAVPVTAPPIYNSRPGAARAIYLDFNGAVVTGTQWNASYNVNRWDVQVWSQDSDYTTFNDAEQTWMRRVWERVAEDYAPFDVNVTTDYAFDPDNTGGSDTIGWLLICTTTDMNGKALPHNGSGGVAYVGVFGSSSYSPNYQPAWVTSTNGGGSEANVAEAASHEMGHNMGLSHDGTSTKTYYGGHGSGDTSWGPIMGTGYGRNVSQWSKGEYFDANMFQDDLAIISGRVPYVADDVGNTNGAATLLVPNGSGVLNKKGLIGTTNDVDVFSFSTGAGSITLNGNPYKCDANTRGGNLDIRLELYNSGGSLLASNDPTTTTTATITTNVSAGTYYLHVKPVGVGTPLANPPNGYTVYGSLGQYTISGTIILPGIGVSESGGSTDIVEGGATDTYSLVLGTAPSDDVIVTITPNAQVTVNKASVTFTTGNWSTPQTVTVTAVDDTLEEGPHTGLITHSASSTDSAFNNIGIASVVPNITDNDTITVTSPNGGESWRAGLPHEVTWTSLLGGNVKIDLLKNNVFYATIIGSTPNDGSYTWAMSSSLIPDPNYRVRITSIEFPTKTDASDADFTILKSYIYYADMNTNPGWTLDTGWAFGSPTGANQDGVGKPDPSSGYDGPNVIGYNLAGDYQASLNATRYARTPAIDCSGYSGVTLSFRRWLGVEGGYDNAYLQVSNNGTSWTQVWRNSTTINVNDDDGAWVNVQYDISAVADNKSTVYIRWGLGTTDNSWNFCGWNIDEVIVDGTPTTQPAGVTITQSGGSTAVAEGGNTDSYTVKLNKAPTASVTVTIAPDSQVSCNKTSLTFTTSNWGTAQSVTVTAVNDTLHEFTHTGSILHTVSSSDSSYNNIAAEGVLVTITDNDNIAPSVNAGPDQTVPLVSSGWTPLSLSPTAWFDASNTASIIAAGGAVSQWNDLSGNNNNVTQGTSGNRPLTGSVTINGLNAIDFDGSNDKLVMSSNPFSPTINDALVMMVHKVKSTTTSGTLFSLNGTENAANRWQSHGPWSNANIYFDTGGSGGSNRVFTAYSAAVNDIVLTSFYGSTTNNVQQIHKNGSLLVGDATGHAVTTSGNPSIGGVSNYQSTSIAEVIMIKGTVSTTSRQELEGYLAHKWGLAGNLPAGHPYKSSPPDASIATANLDGTVSDGNSDPLTTTWSLVSGPAPITINNTSAVDTVATFTTAGVYTLKLEADDLYGPVSDTVVITVANDNKPTVAWTTASQASVSESGTMTVTAQLSAATGQNVTVPFTVTGTASGADYTITSSPITIPSGSTTGTATITITSDTIDEANETVILTMGTPTNATLGTTTVHTATITDDDGAPTVTFTGASSSGSESATAVNLSVSLSTASGQTVTVNYAVSGGTATGGGVDYTLTSGTLTFTPGTTSQNIPVTVVNDTLNESNETIQVTLSGPSNASLGGTTVHTYTIVDNDSTLPTVAWTAVSQASVNESGTMTVTALLNGPSGQTVTVPFTVTGTSTGADRTITASPITISAGSTVGAAVITITQDTLDEPNETVILTMGTPTNATLGATTVHTATITDDDATPTVAWTAAAQASANESGTMTVTAQLSAASGQTVTVPFVVTGSATGADYTITASPLTITAGSTTSTATITITPDTLDEANETVILTIGSPTNATPGATTVHTATITDDDATPTVAFAAASSSGSESVTAVTLPVSLSAASGQSVTVNYAVTGGTALGSGVDYTLANGTLVFSAGTATQNIAITVIDDALNEANETIQVTLSSPGNATLGATTVHTYTITDNDGGLPTVVWTAASQASGSESGTMTVTAQLSATSGQTVTVPFSVSGTATGSDYTITASPITISAGTTTGTATITITPDILDEPDETVILTMGTPTNAALGATTVHTATITDDDATPTVTWTAANQISAGESGIMTVTAQLSSVSGQTVSVPYTVSGTATGADYTISASPITIAAGSTTASATITITTDSIDEANETVILTMGSPTNATQGATTIHTATILDDDAPPTVAWTTASQSSVNESGTMTVTAQLSAVSGQSVTVPYVVSGTATGADYSITASPITIAAGATTGSATITITPDTLDEPDETVILSMGIPTNATQGGITVHTATITDDDVMPTVAWTVASQASANEIGTMTVTAQLSAASSQNVTVPFAVSGTATGADYAITATPLTITAGATSAAATITITTDSLDEANETVILTIGTPTNATVGAILVHTATITDDDGTPTVGWTIASQTSANESGTMTITAQLSAVSGQTVTVPFTVSGTATGADYSITASPITITAGATTATATITITPDTIDETDETVILTIGTPTNATKGGITVHTATIADDDATPTVAWLSASQASTNESGTMTVTAQLSNASDQTITVPFTLSGTATGADYTITASPILISAGGTTGTATITITSDTIDEPNETVILTLGSPINATLGATTVHTATITDDDGAPTVTWTAANQASANESGTMTVTAQLSAVSGQTVTVPFTLSGTATGADYTITASPITIAAGATTGTATITITSDTIDEPDETVVLTMGTPTNATQGATTVHTATITDDDGAPTVAFETVTASGSEALTAVTLPVSLSTSSGQTVTVAYTVTGGTASGSGVDYTLSSGTLTFTAGTTTQNIAVTVVDDGLSEGNETIQVTLSSPSNAALGSPIVHTYTIVDNDSALPTVAWTVASQASTDESGTMTVTAQLSAVSGQNVTVPFTVSGTATGADYTITASPITITAGGTTGSATITITTDTLDEPNETVILTLGTPTNAALGATTEHTATITDDDATPTVAWTVANQASGTESGTMTVTAQLSAASGQTVTVPFTVSGTATGADYTITASPITITAGATTGSATITITFDTLDEPDETVILTMGSPINATVGATTVHTATISDDDNAPTVAWTVASQASAAETGTMTVTAQLSVASSYDVTVPFTVGGTATGSDYAISASPLTITAGTTTAAATITITDDTIVEGNETVVLTIGSPTNATASGFTVHTATITDDDVPVTYTLTYTAGVGGTISGTTPQTVAEGADGTAVTAVPDTGYTFNQWSDGVLTATRTDTNITADLSVTALFDADTYVVSYNGNGNTSGSAPADQSKIHGVDLVLSDQGSLARTGFTFTGWNTAANGSGTAYAANGFYTTNAPITLYAQWSSSVTLLLEGFESPVVAGYSQSTIPNNGKWILAAAGARSNRSGIINKDSGDFANPDSTNNQGYAFRNANTGITTAEGVIAALEAGITYTVSFQVVQDGSNSGVNYQAQLIAFAAGAIRTDCRSTPAGCTVLNSTSGTATTDGLFTTVSFTFIADPVVNAADFGKDLGVRFIGDAAVAIIDNVKVESDGTPTPTVQWAVSSQASGAESGTMTVTAQLSSASALDVSVPFTVSGTATDPDDYTITASPIIITAGNTSGDAVITITSDTIDEPDETVVLTMKTPINAIAGAGVLHTATITDDDGVPSVAFDATSSSGNESVTAVTLPVSLSTASGQTVTVNYAVTGGTATGGGVDYTLASGTLTFTAGTTTQNISLTVVNDTLNEVNETIVVTLSSPGNATVGANATHTYTILDDDSTLPTVAWTTGSQASGTESGTMTVTAQLNTASGQTVTVPFSVTGTATGADYTITASPITIPAGSTTGSATITITPDTIDELDETVILTIGSPTNATVGATTVHIATITDDDATPTVAFNAASSSGSESITAVTLPVTVSAISGQTVTVDYAVTNGTATGGGVDYTLASGTLTFTPGTTTQDIAFTVIDDVTSEPNETIEVTLSNPSNATVGATPVHTYTIVDDDSGLPTVAWTMASQASVNESGTMTVTAQLSAVSASDVTVPYTITGTASGADYTITPSPITIIAGNTTASVTITITDDTINEANETIILTMGTPTNATLGTITVHTATITDDDGAPAVEFTTTASSGSEAVTAVTIPVSLSAASGQTVTVDYAVSGGTATGGGVDYTLASGTLTFPAGTTSQNIAVTVVNDAIIEGDETIEITISAPSNATLGTNTIHTYTITDDDGVPTVAFNGAASSGSEAVSSVTMPVSLSTASAQTITVDYAVSGGTATGGGVDYTLASGTLTFTPGTTTQNIPATVVNDLINESDETILVTLSGPTNATLGGNAVHTYTILDDDSAVPTVAWIVASQASAGESGTMTVTAQLSATTGQIVSVPFSLTGTASGADYTITASPVTIAAGSLTGSATITITPDTISEPNETVILTMGAPTNATLGTTTIHTATITDDDGAPTVSFTLSSSSGTEAITSLFIPVSISSASAQTITVNYAVTGGTATGGGVDYTLSSGTLTFNPGTMAQNILLTVINDGVTESNESILITLSSPGNATLGAISTHTYIILDPSTGVTTNAIPQDGETKCGFGSGFGVFAFLMLMLMARLQVQRVRSGRNRALDNR